MTRAKVFEEISDHSDYAWHVRFDGVSHDFDTQALAQEWCRERGIAFDCFNLFGQPIEPTPDAYQQQAPTDER